MTIIPRISAILKQAEINDHNLDPDNPESFVAIGLPEPAHPVWPAIGSIMNRPYFRRLWTLQEVVLPRKDSITVLCGGRQIGWEVLDDFGIVSLSFKQSIIHWTITGNQSVDPAELNGYTAIRAINDCRTRLKESTNKVFGGGIPLAHLLHASRKREATNSADKIFGMLGMADHGLGKMLNVDVSMSPIEVFVAFARHYLRNEVFECLLNHVISSDRMPGLPSWCPNFGSLGRTSSIGSYWWDGSPREETPNSRRYHAGFGQNYASIPMNDYSIRKVVRNMVHQRQLAEGLFDTQDPRQLSLLDDAHKIRAAGMTIDTITQVVPYNTGIESFTTSVDAIRQTLEWETLCRSLAIQTIGTTADAVPEAYWRTLLANQTYQYIDEELIWWDSSNKTDLRHHYHMWRNYMQQSVQQNKPLPITDAQGQGHGFWFYRQVFQIFTQRSFFATRNGWLGVGPKTMQVGDEIVVFFYCPTPYVLRRKETLYEFLGEAYVHGLMYGEALRMLERGKMNEQYYVLG